MQPLAIRQDAGARLLSEVQEFGHEQRRQLAESEAVKAAKAEVERWWQAELEHDQKRRLAHASVATIESSIGAAILDGADSAKLASKIATANAEISAHEAAIDAARARRADAIAALRASEAILLRAQAAELRAQGEEHRIKTTQLLAELQQHEGCPFAPVAMVLGSFPGVYSEPTSLQMPKSDLLLRKAGELEAQAARLESKPVQQSGQVQGRGAGELIKQISAQAPMVIGPTFASVEHWCAERVAEEQQRRHGFLASPATSLLFTLIWKNGAIDLAQSRAVAA